MKERTVRGGLWLVVLLAIASVTQAQQIDWLPADLSSLQRRARAEDRLFLLYFTADWCAPCTWMNEQVWSDATLRATVSEGYLAAEVDIAQGPGRALQHRFEVEAIPSILVFAADGRLIDQKIGAEQARQLDRWLRRLDKPANHVDNTLPDDTPVELALNTPQAQRHFSRPALLPDASPAVNDIVAPRPQPLLSQQESVAPAPATPEVYTSEAMASNVFYPRSGLRYSIELDEVIAAYEQGVRLPAELERKYEQRAELLRYEDGTYRILIGDFSTTGEARQFLEYLQRNNRGGTVISRR